AVTIGGTAATSVVVVNSTTITAVTPAGTAGTASVLVTTPGGTNAANTLYTYTSSDMSVDLSGLPTAATVGTLYSGTIKCTNSAGATASAISATCGVSGLPAGLTLGACSPVPPATVAAGASITCPVSGIPTVVGSSTVNVTTGAANDGNAANNTGSASIIAIGTPALSLTVAAAPTTFSGIGQTITLTYAITNSGNVTVTGVSVTDTKISPIACLATTLAPTASTTCTGTYVSTAADVTATDIASVATARGTFAAAPVVSTVVTTTVQINVEAVRRATAAAIQGFLSQRANAIASSSPDTGRFHERLTGWLFGGEAADPNAPTGLGGPRDGLSRPAQPAMAGTRAPGSGGADALARDRDELTREARGTGAARPADRLGFTGAADDGAGRFAFATSLSKLRAAAAAEQAQKEAAASPPGGMMGLGSGSARQSATQSSRRFDIWAEGNFSYYSQDTVDGRRQGHTGMLFLGADVLVMPGLLTGLMLQLDSMEESSSVGARNASGHGWMAGPYVSARLTRNLFFDARALWGRSSNEIDPLGAYTDHFETTRALVAAKLTGSWAYGALKFKPSAELTYFTEQQKAYLNAIGIAIDSQTVSLGRLTVGPQVAYSFDLGEGGMLEPFIGLMGVWDFARTTQTTAAGEPVSGNELRGRVEAGMTFRVPSGLSLRALGSYDGIGDDKFHAWQGRATVVLPF
ncbi:MAG: autotransporter domain-containing protein, partial [Hyphomicrobiaceae bacterium]